MEGQLSAAQIAEAVGITRQAVNKRAKKEHWPRQGRVFTAAGLPGDVREAVLRRKYGTDEVTVGELAREYSIDVPAERLGDEAVARKVRMVVECMALRKGTSGRRRRVAEIAERYGFTVATAYRLMERVDRGEPLVKGYRNHGATWDDLGVTLRAWDEDSGRMAIEAIVGNKRRLVDGVTLYRELAARAAQEGLRIGGYRSFMQLMERLPDHVMNLRDKGVRGLREDVVPAIRRDPTAYRAMECLVGDQHKADYYAVDSTGKVVTLELFCWLDFRTQLVWGAVSYRHYNRYTVGQALMNAVRWGLPSMVYTDWGKPELSKYITSLIEQLTGLGIKTEQIDHMKATQRHPQAKPIEGWFSWLDRAIRNGRVPGYCKRLRDSRENEAQQRDLKALIKAGGLLSVTELVGRIMEPIRRWNEHEFKNRQEDTGTSPLNIYKEEVAQHPVTTLSEEVLEYVFLPARETKVRRSQVTINHEHLGRRTYYARALADYNGREASVRFDPFDPGRVWVFVERKLVAEAPEWEMINPKIGADVEAKMREQKRLISDIRELYQGYAPPARPVRRLNPHEREAREVKRARNVRVMRTSLEKRAAVGGSAEVAELEAWRGKYRPGGRQKEEQEYRPVFRLGIFDRQEGDDEDE